jgi:hypothetical protein
MDAYVVIATKGRPQVVAELLDWLQEQSSQPRAIHVIGTEAGDIGGLDVHPLARHGQLRMSCSPPGLCVQRNAGLELVLAEHSAVSAAASPGAPRPKQQAPFFVAFFDDDFRPHPRWLETCGRVFSDSADVSGVTGRVLADGIMETTAITGDAARAYVDGRLPARKPGATVRHDVECLYGCNMAYRDRVVRSCRFDENLPLYGWQEDQDYSSQAKRLGRIIYAPECSGVHLGVKSGRVSGIRFGYSQVANPWYLTRKGTMSARKGLRLVSRNLVANVIKQVTHPEVDYPGRLTGNLLAFADLLRGRSHPLRTVQIGTLD